MWIVAISVERGLCVWLVLCEFLKIGKKIVSFIVVLKLVTSSRPEVLNISHFMRLSAFFDISPFQQLSIFMYGVSG